VKPKDIAFTGALLLAPTDNPPLTPLTSCMHPAACVLCRVRAALSLAHINNWLQSHGKHAVASVR